MRKMWCGYVMQPINKMKTHKGGVNGIKIQQNSWTQHGTTYGNKSGFGSSGDESRIITMLENMCVEQHERHEKESCRCDAFEEAQEERFILVQEHMNAQDTNFNNFASYATDKFTHIRQDMMFHHGSIKININNMISLQNKNHHHYQQFYRELCDFLDVEYGNEGAAWYRGRRLEPMGRNEPNRGRRN